MHPYDIIAKYWEDLGIPKPDRDSLTRTINSIHDMSRGFQPELVSRGKSVEVLMEEAAHELAAVARRNGIPVDECIPNEPGSISYAEGADYIAELLREGKTVGMTGSPGCGKSTFLKDIAARGAPALDEFWPIGSGDLYEMALRELEELQSHGIGVVVAGCIVDPEYIDVRVHLRTTKEQRRRNLALSPMKHCEIRVAHFDVYTAVDWLSFEVQRRNAERVVVNQPRECALF